MSLRSGSNRTTNSISHMCGQSSRYSAMMPAFQRTKRSKHSSPCGAKCLRRRFENWTMRQRKQGLPSNLPGTGRASASSSSPITMDITSSLVKSSKRFTRLCLLKTSSNLWRPSSLLIWRISSCLNHTSDWRHWQRMSWTTASYRQRTRLSRQKSLHSINSKALRRSGSRIFR